MDATTIFITRYVEDHAAAEEWYAKLFGRPCDETPVPNCREWHLRPDVYFQVILDPARSGSTDFGFGVDDLGAERSRLADAGLNPADIVDVPGFAALQWVSVTDPEGVVTGLVNQAGIGSGE